ncbi:MAG: hypothetical protein ABI361_03480 [Nitrososphaera sp.]
MNLMESGSPLIEATTCTSRERSQRKVAYRLTGDAHQLCMDKRDILRAEILACESLLRHCSEEWDREAVESEISLLKMSLDLLP